MDPVKGALSPVKGQSLWLLLLDCQRAAFANFPAGHVRTPRPLKPLQDKTPRPPHLCTFPG